MVTLGDVLTESRYTMGTQQYHGNKLPTFHLGYQTSSTHFGYLSSSNPINVVYVPKNSCIRFEYAHQEPAAYWRIYGITMGRVAI